MTGTRPEGCNTIFIGNLSWDVTEEIIRSTFESVGEISQVRFALDEAGSFDLIFYDSNVRNRLILDMLGQFKGFGHVEFADGEMTTEAVKLAGTMVAGRPIRCDYAPPRYDLISYVFLSTIVLILKCL